MRDRTAEFKGDDDKKQRQQLFASASSIGALTVSRTTTSPPSSNQTNPFSSADWSDKSGPSSGRTSATLGWAQPAASASNRATNNCANTQDIEMGRIAVSEDETWLPEFLKEVEGIQAGLKELQSNIQEIESLENRLLSTIVEMEQKRLRKDLELQGDNTSRLALLLRQRLKRMESTAVSQQPQNPNSANLRMCLTQQAALAKKFRDVIWIYHEIQMKFRQRQTARFERQYRIVNPDATQAEIERVLESDPNVSGAKLFSQSILSSQHIDEAERVLDDVKSRHSDILSITKSIIQLEKLFSELSTLVELQDEQINQVAYQVSQVDAYMENANDTLKKAVNSARSMRRRRWCLVVFCLILLGILAAVIAIYVVPKIQSSP